MDATSIDIIDYELLCAAYSFEVRNRHTLDNDWAVFVQQSLHFKERKI